MGVAPAVRAPGTAELAWGAVADDVDGTPGRAALLRATNVVYGRVEGDLWSVRWTAYNRWVPEVAIRRGVIEVSPLATVAELEGAVHTAVYRADRLMLSMIDAWTVGQWSPLKMAR
jgi:hypothetical protein